MKIILICGHYGCGKTNFALNLCEILCKKGKTVIADMDVINPYFRTSDYKKRLEALGVDVITPVFAGTTVDAPCLSASVNSVFDKKGTPEEYDYAVFDIGGDDAGAVCIAQYSGEITANGYEMLYVINKYREQVATLAGAAETLRDIENACHLKATGIVNNSNLCDETDAEAVVSSFSYADEISTGLNLPVKYTVAERSVAGNIPKSREIFVAERIVLPDWGSERKG